MSVLEFTFRGLAIEALVTPAWEGTREAPSAPASCETFDIAGVQDSDELLEWLDGFAGIEQYEESIHEGDLPAPVRKWIEENWVDAIYDAADDALRDA